MAQVTQSPGTMANDTSVGTVAWSNPDNAKVSDNIYTTAIVVAGGAPNDGSIKIVKADGTIGTTNKSTGSAWSPIESYVSFGSSTDLWGETWTPADINDADFGVVIAVTGDNNSNYLRANNFGFNIPSNAVINGITMEVERKNVGPAGGGTASVDHIRITVDYTLEYDFYLWSSATLPWQLALPWQFLNGWQVIGSVTNYLITGVNVVLSRLRNLLASVTAYTISGVNVNLILETAKVLVTAVTNYTITTVNSTLTRLINLLTATTAYSITTVNALLYRFRCLIAQVTAYSITTFDSMLSRPIRNLYASVTAYSITTIDSIIEICKCLVADVTHYTIDTKNVLLTRLINLLTATTAYSITTIDAIIQRLVTLFADITSYSITTVNAIFTKALNLISSVTDYTITGIDITLSRLINLITEKAEYLITGIDVGLFRPTRNLAVNTASYVITTYAVIFRGIGNWLWRWDTKPSASDWTNGSKPTNTYNNDTKPTSDWINDNKF